jgi:hypothetical protein
VALHSDRFKAALCAATAPLLERIALQCFRARRPRDVDFLTTLYTTGTESRTSPHWIRISDAIASYWPHVCEVLSNSERFGGFENAIGKLFLAVAQQKLAVSGRVLKHSIDLMFRFPTNSFLANFVVAAVRLYAELGGSMRWLFENTNLIGEIIQNCQLTEKAPLSGHLRLIALAVGPWVDDQEWQRVVMPANKRAQEIIQKKDWFGLFTQVAFIKLLNSPANGKLVIWGTAMFFVLVVYATCVL